MRLLTESPFGEKFFPQGDGHLLPVQVMQSSESAEEYGYPLQE
ncbi:MAG: hypothetical protein ACTXOO_05030 [Sodalis sp. (in: enterobacteria)]